MAKYEANPYSNGRNFGSYVQAASNKSKLQDLSIEERNLFELLKLIVDIGYRHRYGNLDDDSSKEYNGDTQLEEVQTDQISPVDDGLSGYNQRELFDKDGI